MTKKIKHTEHELGLLVEIYTWARRMTLTGGNHSIEDITMEIVAKRDYLSDSDKLQVINGLMMISTGNSPVLGEVEPVQMGLELGNTLEEYLEKVNSSRYGWQEVKREANLFYEEPYQVFNHINDFYGHDWVADIAIDGIEYRGYHVQRATPTLLHLVSPWDKKGDSKIVNTSSGEVDIARMLQCNSIHLDGKTKTKKLLTDFFMVTSPSKTVAMAKACIHYNLPEGYFPMRLSFMYRSQRDSQETRRIVTPVGVEYDRIVALDDNLPKNYMLEKINDCNLFM